MKQNVNKSSIVSRLEGKVERTKLEISWTKEGTTETTSS